REEAALLVIFSATAYAEGKVLSCSIKAGPETDALADPLSAPGAAARPGPGRGRRRLVAGQRGRGPRPRSHRDARPQRGPQPQRRQQLPARAHRPAPDETPVRGRLRPSAARGAVMDDAGDAAGDVAAAGPGR